MPININYDFSLSYDSDSGVWSMSGSHDGYPSYFVTADGAVIYDSQQGHIGQLLGCCDVQVGQ
jgi:hypothetical protein